MCTGHTAVFIGRVLFELHTVVLTKSISFEEVQQFAHVLDCLSDVETALSMYSAAGASVTQGEGRG